VQPAAAALEDLSVLGDQHVVADVRPAQGGRVVPLDAADELRGLGGGVAVGARRVVDDDGPQLVGGAGGAHAGLVGAPSCTGGERRCALQLRGGGVGCGGG